MYEVVVRPTVGEHPVTIDATDAGGLVVTLDPDVPEERLARVLIGELEYNGLHPGCDDRHIAGLVRDAVRCWVGSPAVPSARSWWARLTPHTP